MPRRSAQKFQAWEIAQLCDRKQLGPIWQWHAWEEVWVGRQLSDNWATAGSRSHGEWGERGTKLEKWKREKSEKSNSGEKSKVLEQQSDVEWQQAGRDFEEFGAIHRFPRRRERETRKKETVWGNPRVCKTEPGEKGRNIPDEKSLRMWQVPIVWPCLLVTLHWYIEASEWYRKVILSDIEWYRKEISFRNIFVVQRQVLTNNAFSREKGKREQQYEDWVEQDCIILMLHHNHLWYFQSWRETPQKWEIW